MKKTLVTNVRIVTRKGIFPRDILIDGDRIVKIAGTITPRGKMGIIDGQGSYVFPGLIDDQDHFREPGLTEKATILSESRAAVAGGVTSFIEQPNTKPPTLTMELLEEKIAIARRTSFANFGFNLGASNDNYNELARAVEQDRKLFAGIKVFMGSSTGNMLVDNREVLEKIFGLDKLIITHCEDEETIRNNLASYKEKYGDDIPMKFHPAIRNAKACFKSSSLAVELAKKHNTRLHLYHISTADEIKLLDNTTPLLKKRITAEVCLHHLWFTSKDYELLGSKIKWNPAVKDVKHRNALHQALKEGYFDVIATDHAPHTKEEKALPYTSCPSGAPLVQHMLYMLFEMYLNDLITLEEIAEKAAYNPAVVFGIEGRGEIAEGNFADLVFLKGGQYYREWTVSPENILYKCGWSPLEGQKFRSEIQMTMVNGVIVYENTEKYGIQFQNGAAQRLIFN